MVDVIASMELEGKIQDLRKKIEIETKCKNGAEHMLRELKDPNALQQCEMNVVDSQRRLDFLNKEMAKLQSRKRAAGAGAGAEDAAAVEGDFADYVPQGMQKRHSDPGSIKETASIMLEDPRPAGRISMTAHMLGAILSSLGIKGRSLGSSRSAGAASSTSSLSSLNGDLNGIQVPVLCQFDYLRRDTAITSEKVKYKLQEVRSKLEIEQKVKAGTERMREAMGGTAAAAASDTDTKRKVEVEEKYQESNAKVAILQKAQQRYQGLSLKEEKQPPPQTADADNAQPTGESPLAARTLRRSANGKLKIRLTTATALPGRKSAKSETYAVIRLDGVQRAKTKPSRAKWNEEFDIKLDKAQEVEIAVYEKGGTVLALTWFKLWELEEGIRVRNGAPGGAGGSGIARDSSGMSLASGKSVDGASAPTAASGDATALPPPPAPVVAQPSHDGLDLCMEMEPAGQLQAKFNLVSTSLKRNRQKDGLRRHKPVQKIFPKRGHKFVAMQFYQVMKCVVCTEFLMSGQGHQCQLCKFTCHKKCQSRVLAKCITKGNEEKDENDAVSDQLLKHRIPHRFEPASTGMSANWCCHCGYMLPFGKKQSVKCVECSATCHKECMHLVPNSCGLSPGLINQILSALDQAERQKRDKEVQRIEDGRVREQQREREREHAAGRREGSSSGRLADAPASPSTLHPHPQLQPYLNHASSSRDSMYGPGAGGRPSTGGSGRPGSSRIDSLPVTGHHHHHHPGAKGIGLDDFTFIAVLGKGNFGKVLLAEERYSKQLYAIKVLKKEFIIENDEVESTKAEKRVFLAANRQRHPFLVNLHSCFQTESRIYFVMEYVSGGDLMWHIQHQQFSEKRAKFYAAEVLLALEYFHKENIVYRDLKLDNILLSPHGHIKIADYGLCKEQMAYGATTNTFCGTPEFMAPEILQDKPYGRAVDWWAFGVLIYEMLLGQSPFRGEDEEEIFEAILEDEILYPVNMAKDAVSLLQKLLTKDPAKRLGGGKTDADDIKKHAFFKGMDWDAMLQLQLSPPYFPKITSPTDVSNFDEEFTKEEPVLTPCTSVLSAADQEDFRGFTYVSEWAQTARNETLQALALQQQQQQQMRA
ncbi:Serine/threonine kinase [Geranomyces michiganensis]|nr:Serine/threonine kinase [Geranomyces michiganensis]